MLFYSNKMYLLENETDICVYNDTCDDYMKSLKLKYCTVIKVDLNGIVYNVIIGDTHFEKLDNRIQSFFLNHEIGHIKNKHLDSLSEKDFERLVFKRVLGLTPKMEFEADAYAASVIVATDAKYSLLC